MMFCVSQQESFLYKIILLKIFSCSSLSSCPHLIFQCKWFQSLMIACSFCSSEFSFSIEESLFLSWVTKSQSPEYHRPLCPSPRRIFHSEGECVLWRLKSAVNTLDLQRVLHWDPVSPFLTNKKLMVSKQIPCSQCCHMIKGRNIYLLKSRLIFEVTIASICFPFLTLNLFQNFK